VKLLIDTHALLWWLYEPKRLSRKAVAFMSDPGNTLKVSAASAWEIATKHRLGNLPGVEALVQGWSATLAHQGFEALPIDSDHAVRSGSWSVKHRDPFDRMLAAQAEIEALIVVTRDRVFKQQFRIQTAW
jgi:PIN domain nuclease of toxin-antitoxin system